MLTLYQQLPLDERLSSDLVGVLMQKKMSIPEKLEGLFNICGKSQSFRIEVPHQALIYQKLIKPITNDKPSDIDTLSLEIWKWAKIIGHCEQNLAQDNLLAYELKLITQVEYLDPTISGHVIGQLPHFHQSSQSPILLQALLKHLKMAHKEGKAMHVLVMHSAISSLRYIDLTTDVGQTIARELTWHVEKNTASGEWFNSVALSHIFFDLGKVSFTEDIEKLLQALLPHVQHNDSKIEKKEYGIIIDELTHMPDNPTVQSIMDVMKALSLPVEDDKTSLEEELSSSLDEEEENAITKAILAEQYEDMVGSMTSSNSTGLSRKRTRPEVVGLTSSEEHTTDEGYYSSSLSEEDMKKKEKSSIPPLKKPKSKEVD